MILDLDTRRKLYDQLYSEVWALLKTYDPCKIKDGKCLRGRFCCAGCEHDKYEDRCEHDDYGRCKTKSLLCGLWLCSEAAKLASNKDFIQYAKGIFERGYKHNLMVFRGGKEDLVDNPSETSRMAIIEMPWKEEYKIRWPELGQEE